MSLVKLLKEFNIHNDIEEFKNFLEDYGIDFGSDDVDYYIDSGGMGDVYKVKGTSKVIKIWKATAEEFEVNKKVMEATKSNNLEHVAKIYYLKKIGEVSESNQLFLSVIEYLEELPFDIYANEVMSTLTFMEQRLDSKEWKRKDITERQYAKKALKGFEGSEDKRKDITRKFQKIKNNYKTYDDLKMAIFQTLSFANRYPEDRYLTMINHYAEEPQFYIDVYKGIQEYKDLGIKHGDVHAGNVLKDPKSGNYKLIDPHRQERFKS